MLIIEKFKDFNPDKKLKYYIFDWDDNILNMNTPLYLDDNSNKITINPKQFAELLNTGDIKNYQFRDDSFIEFRDIGKRGDRAFITDVKNSLSKKDYGPVWYKFIDCLISGSVFAIVTARGHEPETIREVVLYIINKILTRSQKNEMIQNLLSYKEDFDYSEDENLIDTYLDNCEFIGVSSKSFQTKYKNAGNVDNPQVAKQIAINEFLKKINKWGKKLKAAVSVGFSDDTTKNVNQVKDFFNEVNLNKIYKWVNKYHIYDTNDHKNIKKYKFE